MQSALQVNELYKNSSIRLNQIYLYFDFRNIEENPGTFASMQFFNKTLTMFGAYKDQAEQLIHSGAKNDCEKIDELLKNTNHDTSELSKAINSQIESIVPIQEYLRKQYNKFSD